jgi:hypothetical protein
VTGLVAVGRFRNASPGAMVGMKPPAFAEWMFRQLGASRGDRLDNASAEQWWEAIEVEVQQQREKMRRECD